VSSTKIKAVFFLGFFIERRSNNLLVRTSLFLICTLVSLQFSFVDLLASEQLATATFYLLPKDSKLSLQSGKYQLTATVDEGLFSQTVSPKSTATLILKPVWDQASVPEQTSIVRQLSTKFQITLTGFPIMVTELPNREKVEFNLEGQLQSDTARIHQLDKIHTEVVYFWADIETQTKGEGNLFKMKANLDLTGLHSSDYRFPIILELNLTMSSIEPSSATKMKVKSQKKAGKYQVVDFEQLSNYPLKVDDYAKLSTPEGLAELALNSQIPETILVLHGRSVAIEGFMLPVVSEKGWISEFMLLRDTQACCFGVIPELNEWVYVKVNSEGKGVKSKRKKVRFLNNVPVTVKGKLLVGSQIDPNTGVNIYVMQADDVAIAKR